MQADRAVARDDVSFKSPYFMLVCGPANCGKSVTIGSWICNSARAFHSTYNYVCIVAGHQQQPAYDRVRQYCHDKHIAFDLVTQFEDSHIRDFCSVPRSSGERRLLWLDDQYIQLDTDKKSLLTDLCCNLAHHSTADVIVTTQSLRGKSVSYRQALQNCTYLVLFPSLHTAASVRHLSGAWFPLYRPFLSEIIACYSTPHCCFIIDSRQECPSHLRVRQGTPADDNIHIYALE